jgi:hypothetical protein
MPKGMGYGKKGYGKKGKKGKSRQATKNKKDLRPRKR